MAYKTISVIVTDMSADGPTLNAARDIADREGAHLDVRCIGIDPARYEPMPAGTAIAVLEYGAAEASEQANKLRDWATDHLGPNLSSTSIEPVIVPQMGIETLVARSGRYSDLIVATKPYGAGRTPLHTTVLEAELFGTATPVLIVPEQGDLAAAPFKRIVCAWNESSESFNAIRLALPFLQAADKVDLVMVDPPTHSPERSDPGGAITIMLARHGVKAQVSILAKTMPRISDVIARFAEEQGADLIVMGGYGHSRFRESILGGATRDTLENSKLPLLMAH